MHFYMTGMLVELLVTKSLGYGKRGPSLLFLINVPTREINWLKLQNNC